jgi:tripartite-type tricarboxylate transporter receptor subunit TctC
MRAAVRKSETPRRRPAPHGNERRLVTQHPRRRILSLAAGAAALPVVSRIAWPQAYPTRPVRLIVGFAAGGQTDIIARLLGQWLSVRLGQPLVIENRPGAGTNIATEAVVKAPPDGHTLLFTTSANATNPALYGHLNFSFLQDIAPVASIERQTYVMAVNPSFPANTVIDFIAYAQANPGGIAMASGGNGTLSHIAGELFKISTGINMVHVPYRGGQGPWTDLIGGQVQVYFGGLADSIEHIRAGKLRALAVTTAIRSELLPAVPTVGETVFGYEASGWYGIGAPKNTPAEIIRKLNIEINAVLADPALKARFADLGGTVLSGSPADFGMLIADETNKWGKVIRGANIKAE